MLLSPPPTPFATVPFARSSTRNLLYTLEAAHSHPRILYWRDWTGKVITEELAKACSRHPNITQVVNTIVTSLTLTPSGVVRGVRTLDKETRELKEMQASEGVVLCSGGLSNIYLHSTNPTGYNALGTTTALASRVKAAVKDLEYVQFHPTALNLPGEARYLLTEALRGEGAILRDSKGRAFAKDYHTDGELAPRDVVARAVYENSLSGGAFLDISHRDEEWLKGRFPSIDSYLSQRGVDFTKQPLPCVPAAHYACGGVAVDLKGRTSVEGLYGAGEGTRTGVHGGNR